MERYDFRVVDLAPNQAAKPWKPIFRSVGTICGGLFPKKFWGYKSATLNFHREEKHNESPPQKLRGKYVPWIYPRPTQDSRKTTRITWHF